MKRNEGAVQAAIINYLKSLKDADYPIEYEKRQAGGFSYKKGMPDIWFTYNGIHVEVEVKDEGGHRSPMQEKWEERCKRKNIPYCCAYSVEDVKELLIKVIEYSKAIKRFYN